MSTFDHGCQKKKLTIHLALPHDFVSFKRTHSVVQLSGRGLLGCQSEESRQSSHQKREDVGPWVLWHNKGIITAHTTQARRIVARGN